ncbi:MAG TPA: bifunctional riboflavin kinase/FAD synthetase [Candidatus Eisenbacteria bacterium]|nr:bifunctional riboflavin kinase/FAD synthetase [Candidatus Eisenbacteria bacterium]
MEIVHDLEHAQPGAPGSVVTIGNFDGIHLGHQALVRSAVEEAQRRGLPAVVVTFEPHPLKVLAPERAPRMLLAPEDKMELLASFGVDLVVAQRFDREFAAIEAQAFVRRYLAGRLKTKKIWVGRDLRFGRERRGSVPDLVRWGALYDYEVGIIEPILVNGARISSSEIRRMIEQGRVDEVRPMLGRHHFVSGTVVSGNQRGRDLGFPTANLSPRTEVVPLDGIYATLFEVRRRQWPSVSSIGFNPTFPGGGKRTVETFIFDFEGDLYGESVKLFFVKRIREERKFPSVEALVAQMRQDASTARTVLEGLGHRAGSGVPD